MWIHKLLVICATLSMLAACLKVVLKPPFSFKTSGLAVRNGRLLIGNSVKPILYKTNVHDEIKENGLADDTEGYQSDQADSTAWHKIVESKLWSLNPSVCCGGDSMTLHLEGNKIPNLLIDKGHGNLVPVTQMLASCGFSVTPGLRDVLFIILYEGCYVTQQRNSYVLAMRFWGIPISLSCPMASHDPTTFSCLTSIMVTKIKCKSVDTLQINVNGVWEPLIQASDKCGITAEASNDGILITAPYHSSCWQTKGNERLLFIQSEDGVLKFSCRDVIEGPEEQAHGSLPDPQGNAMFMYHSPYESLTPLANITTLNTNIPTVSSVPVSDPKKTVYPLTETHQFPSMHYHHKPYRHPWASLSRTASSVAPTTASTSTTTTSISDSETKDLQYPFQQRYYPYGPMYYHYKPMHQRHPWATLTTKTLNIATTATTVPLSANIHSTTTIPANVQVTNTKRLMYPFPQLYYPLGPRHYYNPMHHRYPYATPTARTTTTTISSTPKVTSTALPPSSTVSTSRSQEVMHPFAPIYYPFGPMHHAQMHHHGYPWAFPVKALTSKPPITISTTVSPTVSTTTLPARHPKQSVYSFPQYFPFAYMPYHRSNQFYQYGYPWALNTVAPTSKPLSALTPNTVFTSDSQHMYPFRKPYYPFSPMNHRQTPWPYYFTKHMVHQQDPVQLVPSTSTRNCSG